MTQRKKNKIIGGILGSILVLGNLPLIPEQLHWHQSYETFSYDTASENLEKGQYAFAVNNDGYLVNRNGDVKKIGLDGDVIGLQKVRIKGYAYFNDFQDDSGHTYTYKTDSRDYTNIARNKEYPKPQKAIFRSIIDIPLVSAKLIELDNIATRTCSSCTSLTYSHTVNDVDQNGLMHVSATGFITSSVVGLYLGGTSSDTGASSSQTQVNDTNFGSIAWTNPGKASASDNGRVQATLAGTTSTNYLKVTNFGYDIPSTATIRGILVEIEKSRSGGSAGNARDSVVSLVKSDGTVSATNKADTTTNWPTSEAYTPYGSVADLWSETWTYNDINDPDFGVVLAAKGSTAGTDRIANVDHIRLTVYYSVNGRDFTQSVSQGSTPNIRSWYLNNISAGANNITISDSNGGTIRIASVSIKNVTTNNPPYYITDAGSRTNVSSFSTTISNNYKNGFFVDAVRGDDSLGDAVPSSSHTRIFKFFQQGSSNGLVMSYYQMIARGAHTYGWDWTDLSDVLYVGVGYINIRDNTHVLIKQQQVKTRGQEVIVQ